MSKVFLDIGGIIFIILALVVVIFSGEGNSSIARIKEKVSQQDRFIYKASKDNRTEDVFEVRPDRIIGILEQ